MSTIAQSEEAVGKTYLSKRCLMARVRLAISVDRVSCRLAYINLMPSVMKNRQPVETADPFALLKMKNANNAN